MKETRKTVVPKVIVATPKVKEQDVVSFIRYQNSWGDVENGFCGGVAGLRNKEDKRPCSRFCPSWRRTPPNRMKVEEAACQVVTVVLRKA